MAQAWTVVKAFQSTDQETKEPQVVQTQGGDNHKFMVQVEGQPVAGWIGILKKIGNKVEVGDELYGDIVENNWGKPQFNRAQRPDGQFGPQKPAAQAATTSAPASADLEAKIDYLTSLIENFLESQGGQVANKKDNDTVLTDIDDGPVDLSEIDY